jgi:hypothetical protein
MASGCPCHAAWTKPGVPCARSCDEQHRERARRDARWRPKNLRSTTPFLHGELGTPSSTQSSSHRCPSKRRHRHPSAPSSLSSPSSSPAFSSSISFSQGPQVDISQDMRSTTPGARPPTCTSRALACLGYSAASLAQVTSGRSSIHAIHGVQYKPVQSCWVVMLYKLAVPNMQPALAKLCFAGHG